MVGGGTALRGRRLGRGGGRDGVHVHEFRDGPGSASLQASPLVIRPRLLVSGGGGGG